MIKQVSYRVICATAIAMALVPTAASASPAEYVDTAIEVEYSDLNIHNENGAKTLYSRLQRASKIACDVRPYREIGSLEYYVETQRCFEQTLGTAVSRFDSDALSKLHANS